MDKKKLKILLVFDIIALVALMVVMMSNKSGYEAQAKKSDSEQVEAYRAQSNGVLQDLWKSLDEYSMAWKLVYTTLSGSRSEADFATALAAIEGDKDARFKQVASLYTAAGIPEDLPNSLREKNGMSEKSILLKDEKGVKEVACGKNCVVKFSFVKGKFKSVDYSALVEYKMADHFKLEAPAPFHFE